jgi:hypothetical protein
VSDRAIELLRQTRPWALMIGVLSLLGCGFCVLVGLGMSAFGFAEGGREFPGWIGLLYVPMGAVGVYPGVKLCAYDSAIGRLVRSRTSAELEQALGQQKSFWKYCGIAFLGYIAFCLAIMVVALVVGFTRTHMGHGG